MSIVPEEVKAEDGKAELKNKHFYCEVCKIYCTCAISLQSHYRGAKHRKLKKNLGFLGQWSPNKICLLCIYLEYGGSSALIQVPMKYRVLKRVKRSFTGYITCLKDFMNDPRREEPLIGLEHVVEIRFAGRREPRYECRLCGCNTEVAPMIEHLSGYKHRREYISKAFPDKMRRRPTDIKKCKVSFLRRIAGELEKSEGLKMYQIEGYTRPAISSPLKKKARLEDDKHENDPVRKQKALEFLETFHITSDSEATLVVHITQELMEALKAFCEKKAADNCTDSFDQLVSVPQDEFPERKSIPEHYGPDGEYEGSSDWNQGFLSQYEECSEDAAFPPAHSNSYQADGGLSSCPQASDNFAMMSPLRDTPAVDPYSPVTGISEWLRLQNSVFCRNSAAGTTSYETSLVKEYSAEYISSDVQGSELLGNQLSFGWEDTKWRHQQESTKARHISDQELPYPNSSASYPPSGRYSTNYHSQNYSSYMNNESVNTGTSSGNSAVSGRAGSRWHQDAGWNEWNEDSGWNKKSSWKQESRCQGFRYQKSGYQRNWSSHQDSFSGSGLYQDHQQFRSSEEIFDGVDVGLAPNAVNRLLGKDVPTMTSMLKQLAPYYPGLQRINTQTFVNVLIETREKD